MIDVYVTDSIFPWYQVWVDGKVYDQFVLRFGPRLTWSQMYDIAEGYREALDV